MINDKSELPKILSVLTKESGRVPIFSQEIRRELIAVEIESKNKLRQAILLVSQQFKDVFVISTYLESLKQEGFSTQLDYSPPQLIEKLYEEARLENTATDLRRRMGEFERRFDQIVQEALSQNASDIHIETRRKGSHIRLRINGRMTELTRMTSAYALDLARVIYSVLAEEKDVIFNPMSPQSAIVNRTIDSKEVRLRLQTLPAYPDGFDLILRILVLTAKTEGELASLDELGYSSEHEALLEKATAQHVGVIVISGETGSGKSTTLNNLLSREVRDSRSERKILTIEDPPEYALEGATQIPVVRAKAEQANIFTEAIKAALRSDPDTIMIGEIRDADSIKELVKAVQSGHKVYTTIHTSSAIGIVERMANLGCDRSIIGSPKFLSALVYQSLVRKICPHCAKTRLQKYKNASEIERRALSQLESRLTNISMNRRTVRYKGEGCQRCNFTAEQGRTVIAEIIIPDEMMLEFFRDGKDTEAMLYWKNNLNGKTAAEHGLNKVRDGLVDPFDYESKMGHIDQFTKA
jgi:type II secretory ATPase GspE/PulE/Tfp pilus assembly ATPase PilB-like protein